MHTLSLFPSIPNLIEIRVYAASTAKYHFYNIIHETMCQFLRSFKYVVLKFHYYRSIEIKTYHLHVLQRIYWNLICNPLLGFIFLDPFFVLPALDSAPDHHTGSHFKISRIAGGTPPTNAGYVIWFSKRPVHSQKQIRNFFFQRGFSVNCRFTDCTFQKNSICVIRPRVIYLYKFHFPGKYIKL